MRKLIFAIPLALSLNACAGGPTIDTAQITAVEQQVVAATQAACGFIPTIGTVASIIATFTGGGAIVDIIRQAANGICGAVTAKSVRLGGRPPAYRGIRIRGQFTR